MAIEVDTVQRFNGATWDDMDGFIKVGNTWVPITSDPPDPPPGPTQTISYTEDTTTDFIRPEGGWMHRRNRSESGFANARNGDSAVPHGYSVIWYDMGGPNNGAWGSGGSGPFTPFRLDQYINADLPTSLLNELTAVFNAARSAGIKLKIRFAYNYGDNKTADPLVLLGHPAGRTRIVGHIQQVAPIINANRDVIAQMDSGFLGFWGEWNYAGGTNWWSEPFLTSYATIYQALVNNIHQDIMLGFRYPRHDRGHRLFFNGSGGDRVNWNTWNNISDRFSGSAASRSGWYYDCLYADQSHQGTFNFDGGQQATDLAAAMKFGRVAACSGETCSQGGLNSVNDGQNVISNGFAAFEKISIDMLYRHFWTNMYNKWISSGHYPEISRRLGYRLSLVQAVLPTTVTAGQSMTVDLRIKNSGFGKLFNRRPLDLVFVGSGGPFTARMRADVRRDLPLAGETVDSSYTFTAPAGLVSGQSYVLHLRLPDASASITSDNRYAVRLANAGGMWNEGNGRNSLAASVTVA